MLHRTSHKSHATWPNGANDYSAPVRTVAGSYEWVHYFMQVSLLPFASLLLHSWFSLPDAHCSLHCLLLAESEQTKSYEPPHHPPVTSWPWSISGNYRAPEWMKLKERKNTCSSVHVTLPHSLPHSMTADSSGVSEGVNGGSCLFYEERMGKVDLEEWSKDTIGS